MCKSALCMMSQNCQMKMYNSVECEAAIDMVGFIAVLPLSRFSYVFFPIVFQSESATSVIAASAEINITKT